MILVMMIKNNSYNRISYWLRTPFFAIGFMITLCVFRIIANVFAGLSPGNFYQAENIKQEFIMTLFQALGLFLFIWFFVKYVEKESFSAIGFRKLSWRSVLLGLLMGFLIMSAAYLILLYAGQISYRTTDFIFSDTMFSFFIFIFVALLEELLVRGYLLSVLMGSVNRSTALIISAVIFSLLHGMNQGYGWFTSAELFLSGIMLGLSYIYTRNLWFPVALHFSWNFFQGTVFGFSVSGTNTYSIIHQGRPENNIWNGGAFGFEGSVLSVLFQIIAIFIIYRLFHKKGESGFLDAQ